MMPDVRAVLRVSETPPNSLYWQRNASRIRTQAMTIVRFVHAADLHLDSPFVGMKSAAPQSVADALYDATFQAYENIISLCVSERVDALLVAGDVYDSADRSLRAQRKFIDGLQRLHDQGIRSFVCHGNHDPLDGWEARLDYPPTCVRFGAAFESAPIFPDDPTRAVVHGISYPTRDVYENLVHRLGIVDPTPFSIGLLHANVGNNTEHAAYAPCSLADLEQSGIDYWALGHVHTREVLSAESPTVVYPGNPQGRHSNESGPRGVYIVEVDDGRNARLEFRAMDTIRWEQRELDVSRMEADQELLDELHEAMRQMLDAADDRPIIARLALTGRGVLHSSLRKPGFTVEHLREEINSEWAGASPFAWCERIEDRTASPFDRAERVEGLDFMAEVLKTADRAKDDPEQLARLRAGVSDLYQHRRFRRYLSDHDPSDDDIAALIDGAEATAVNLLIEEDTQ